MFEKILSAFGSPEFWSALQTLIAVLVALAAGVGWLIRFFIGRSLTEKALLRYISDEYLNWVEVTSQRNTIDSASFEDWLESKDGILRFGKRYDGYKWVVKQIQKKSTVDLKVLSKDEFFEIDQRVSAKPRWSRNEW